MIPLKIEVTRRYKMHPITNSVSICYLIYECITDFAYCKLCFQTFFILMHDICHAMSCFVCTSLNVMQSDRLPFTQRLCRLFLFICTGTFKSFTVVFVPAFFNRRYSLIRFASTLCLLQKIRHKRKWLWSNTTILRDYLQLSTCRSSLVLPRDTLLFVV